MRQTLVVSDPCTMRLHRQEGITWQRERHVRDSVRPLIGNCGQCLQIGSNNNI